MRNFILSIACLLISSIHMHAQPVLLGMTKKGGTAQTGTIISHATSSATLSVLNNFEGIETSGTCKIMKATDGMLYGTIYNGGYGHGSIYSFDPVANTYTTLLDFNGLNGSSPWGLIEVNGKLYGTTANGGSSSDNSNPNGYGVLYSFDPQTKQYNKLVDFNATRGTYPKGLTHLNGKLYGITGGGGSNNKGVIFSYDLAANITNPYTKLKDFDGAVGDQPTASLLWEATVKKFYGMMGSGGSWNRGTIYSFDAATHAIVKHVDFDGTNGTRPNSYASLMQAGNGKMYGMTESGGSYGSSGVGVVFSFDPGNNECKSIKDFDVTSGSTPFCDLIELNGRLHGMTSKGGATDNGVIFSIDLQSNNFTKERDFEINTGGGPLGNLVLANDGKLYGANSKNSIGYGDNHSAIFGNIFSFEAASALSTYSVLKTFGYNNNGSFASAGFMKASDGKYYGITIDGGSKGFGVLFTFDPLSKTYTKQYEFDQHTGSNPYGSLIQMDNRLFGMTNLGGRSDRGVLFSFDLATKAYQNLKDFAGVDGSNPYGSLLVVGNKLYGMTKNGGSNNLGVIFSFDLATNHYTKLKDFDGASGANPNGNLVRASNGKLYGMTYTGGSSNMGVIFSFDPASGVANPYTKLKDFDGSASGRNPYGSLLVAKNGKLFGMTLMGGKASKTFGGTNNSTNYGVIFSLDPATNTFTKLKDFDNTNGAHPSGSLMQASNGKFYGVTGGGGAYNKGVLFSYDVSSRNPYIKLKDFDGVNGAHPQLGSFLIEMSGSSSTAITSVMTSQPIPTIEQARSTFKLSAYPNPTSQQFTLNPNSSSSAFMQLKVVDISGRVIEVRHRVPANQPINIGGKYLPGIYLLEIKQGGELIKLKLMKN